MTGAVILPSVSQFSFRESNHQGSQMCTEPGGSPRQSSDEIHRHNPLSLTLLAPASASRSLTALCPLPYALCLSPHCPAIPPTRPLPFLIFFALLTLVPFPRRHSTSFTTRITSLPLDSTAPGTLIGLQLPLFLTAKQFLIFSLVETGRDTLPACVSTDHTANAFTPTNPPIKKTPHRA